MKTGEKDYERALSDFFHLASHDLEAPVRRIGWLVKDVLEKEKDNISSESSDFLSMAVSTVDTYMDLIGGLIELSRIQSIPISREDVDITQLVNNLTNSLHYPGTIFTVDPGLTMCCDKSLTTTLLLNLLKNACKFSSNKVMPLVKVGRIDDFIYVEDNGIGIEEQNFSIIFEPFKRAFSSQSRFEGKGLGLSIVNRIVNLHNGTIKVESEYTKFTRFLFNLGKEKC